MAEALASGCHLVGYDGVGGRELFAIAEQFQASHSVPYYDFSCFISTVERVAALYDPSLVHEYDHSLMLDSSELVRNRYSFNSFVKSVERAFSEFD